MTTATGILHRHLQNIHTGDWVDECNKQGLQINGAEAQAIAADYQQEIGRGGNSMKMLGVCTRFTKEAFVGALVEFIVSDDQVSACCQFAPISTNYFD